jgi:hypoxanthine-guanine phosphoribosyltransferase
MNFDCVEEENGRLVRQADGHECLNSSEFISISSFSEFSEFSEKAQPSTRQRDLLNVDDIVDSSIH